MLLVCGFLCVSVLTHGCRFSYFLHFWYHAVTKLAACCYILHTLNGCNLHGCSVLKKVQFYGPPCIV